MQIIKKIEELLKVLDQSSRFLEKQLDDPFHRGQYDTILSMIIILEKTLQEESESKK